MSPPPITTGTIINDRYEIQGSQGKWGMAELFRAHDRRHMRLVDIMFVRVESRMPRDDDEGYRRWEMLNAQRVRHRNVWQIYDAEPSPWGPLLITEHLEGLTLHTVIRRRK